MDCVQIDGVVAGLVLKLLNKLGLKCDSNYALKNVNTSNLYV